MGTQQVEWLADKKINLDQKSLSFIFLYYLIELILLCEIIFRIFYFILKQ